MSVSHDGQPAARCLLDTPKFLAAASSGGGAHPRCGAARRPQAAVGGGVAGFVAGWAAGSLAVGALSSGAKTILALWAEDPAPLRAARPELHSELEQHIRRRRPGEPDTPAYGRGSREDTFCAVLREGVAFLWITCGL